MNCSFCGEKANGGYSHRNGVQFDCGTFVWGDEIDRSNQSPKCINAEVGALKARIARLEDYAHGLEVIGDEMKQAALTCDAAKWDAQRARRPKP